MVRGDTVDVIVIRKDTRAIQCWDNNGNAVSSVAGQYTSVGLAGGSGCASKVGGGVECWGSSTYQYAGKPGNTAAAGVFTKVVGADNSYCGLKSDGTQLGRVTRLGPIPEDLLGTGIAEARQQPHHSRFRRQRQR